ncbi:hypothetical protein KP509_12G036500 [Ceratopteris richardii]|uniref:Uncharacterized protein n=1 Tax=Ceratopteris richardii TaxID=49495 RepID=A0A8T2TMJ8_CERRI|nr:hypothetical protein KP509_12G036500 [Ceratopteris richardii]
MDSKNVQKRLTILEFFKLYFLITGVGAVIMVIYLLVRMVITWQVLMFMQCQTTLQFSLLVGTDVGLLVVIAYILYSIPHIIIAWTTSVILKCFVGERIVCWVEIAEDAKNLAVGFWQHSLKQAFNSGEMAAVVVALITLVYITIKHLPTTFVPI